MKNLPCLILRWFTQERQKGIFISGPLVKEKALQLSKLMGGDPSFSAICGSLEEKTQNYLIAGENCHLKSKQLSCELHKRIQRPFFFPKLLTTASLQYG